MKKNIIITISILIVVAVMTLVIVFMKTEEPKTTYTEDEVKFKEEYEKVNGIEYKEGHILKDVNINNDNNVKYVSDDEIIDVLTKDSNVVYLGWPECNWCRTILPVLLDTLKENNIDTLYYYNFKKLRTAYEEGKDEKLVSIYEDIIDIIGKDVSTVFSEDSSKAGEKRIVAPTVVFIKDGNYLGCHVGSVETQKNSEDDLSDKERKELEKAYQKYLDQINTSVCVDDEGC